VARSKPLECLQKRVLNIIFPGSEYVTTSIIANVETLSHNDSYTLTAFLQTVISLPPPLWIRHWWGHLHKSTLDRSRFDLERSHNTTRDAGDVLHPAVARYLGISQHCLLLLLL